MKQRYEEILNTKTGSYRIEVKRNSSKFIVKVGKVDMKNFDKKAELKKMVDTGQAEKGGGTSS